MSLLGLARDKTAVKLKYKIEIKKLLTLESGIRAQRWYNACGWTVSP